jgi:endo-1,3-1,4-beta-glycanase ExoK
MNKFFAFTAGVLLFSIMPLSAKDYNGAEMYSKEKIKYGRFDMRLRSIHGSGVVSAFFTYYDDSYLGNPEPWEEIDIEILGKRTDEFQSNIITGSASNKKTSEKLHNFSDLSAAYHTYSIEWAPDYIAWFFDGQEVRRTTDGQVADCQKKDMSYRFNAWVSDVASWAGAFDPSILPVYMYINWISYSSYTPGAGEGGSNFTPVWKDDFDTFDRSRWAKGDWTFDGNMVDFSEDNIIVKDGYCIIGITRAGQTGFSGTVPADEITEVIGGNRESRLMIAPSSGAVHTPNFVSLNGRSLPGISRFNSGKVSPGIWITRINDQTRATVSTGR